ncbi:MAG: cell division protein FtsZ [Marinifilaceae bacterium]
MEKNDLFEIVEEPKQSSIIKVVGVGGGGSNAVNYMYTKGIDDVDFIVCNTDIQALRDSPVKTKIQIGKELTCGLGAGSKPEKGRDSALESIEYIEAVLKQNTKMVFVTAGMGGGTGTGAAPVIAKKARDLGILTVGIVTIPFYFEGRRRLERAVEGIKEINDNVDAILIINNQRLREMYGNLKLSEAFAKADDVLAIAARSIAEIITSEKQVYVDLQDVMSITKDAGVAVMGSGEGEGSNRGVKALDKALTSPLLNSSNIYGASNILLNIVGGETEPTAREIDEITQRIQEKVGSTVNTIWGYGVDKALGDKVRVTIIATGFTRNQLPCYQDMEVADDRNPNDVPLEVLNATKDLSENATQDFVEDFDDRNPNDDIYHEEAPKKASKRVQVSNDSDEMWLFKKLGTLFADRDTKM